MTATLNPLIVADFTTSLAAAVAVGATTATLQSATDSDGVALAAGTYAFAVDSASSAYKEYFIATLSGTSLSAIQSVSRQGALSSGFAKKHRLGATVTLTDHASLRVVSDLLRGSGTLNPSSPLNYDSHPTFSSNTQLIDKKYADDLAIAGSPNASTTVKGIVEAATSAEVTAGTATGSTGAVLAVTPDALAAASYGLFLPTTGQKDALAGTSGSPSSSNKYVTSDDVSTAAGADKIVRATGTALPALSGNNLTTVRANRFLTRGAGVTITNTTTETTLCTVSIPASTLASTGGIKVRIPFNAMLSAAISATNFHIKMKYGATTVTDATITGTNTGSGTMYGVMEFELYNNASVSSQVGWSRIIASVQQANPASPGSSINVIATGTASENSSNTLTFAITGQWDSAVSTFTVTTNFATVEAILL